VIESGMLTDHGDHYAAAGPLQPLAIPATLHGSLLARLDRLASVREVAQIGAALGRQFSHELISAVAAMPQPQLVEALAQLVSAELVYRRGVAPDAEYTFKHALVQDAAYGMLLRERRQQLHARIGAILEERRDSPRAKQPEVLAHHFTEAGQIERAIGYWREAGEQALKRSGMAEAEALLRRGLALLPRLPDDSRRRKDELDLQLALGRALIATRGWGAPTVGEAYARARELCEARTHPRKLLPIMYGQFVHHALRADLLRAEQLAAEMRQVGEAQGDVVTRVMAYRVSGYASLALGEFVSARVYLERSLVLYNPTDRLLYEEVSPQSTLPTLLSFLSCALTCSGYLDEAVARQNAATAEAHGLSHAYTSTYILWWVWYSGWLARTEPDVLLQVADELLALSAEGRFGFWPAMARANRGWCLAALGHPEQGISLLVSGLADHHGQFTPAVLTMLADANRIAGQPQAGLEHLAEAERMAEATKERMVLAETHRLRGDLLILTGERVAAEASYRAAISLARRQSAKLFELRSATRLARLWRGQGKIADAQALLAPVYGWFTEGFDTRDLKEAKALLDELS
jgi:predicted ATPase